MSGFFSLSTLALRQTSFPYLWVPLSHFLWLSPFLAPVQSHFRSLHSKGPKLAKVIGDLFPVKTFSPPRPQMLDMLLLPSFSDLTLSLLFHLLLHWLPGPASETLHPSHYLADDTTEAQRSPVQDHTASQKRCQQ